MQSSSSSSSSPGLISTLGRSTIDLVAGYVISNLSESVFVKDWTEIFKSTEVTTSNAVIAMKAARVWLQLAFTTILSLEVRNLYTSPDTEDPMGGLMFMMAVGQQPKFWCRVEELFKDIKNKFMLDVNHSQSE